MPQRVMIPVGHPSAPHLHDHAKHAGGKDEGPQHIADHADAAQLQATTETPDTM